MTHHHLGYKRLWRGFTDADLDASAAYSARELPIFVHELYRIPPSTTLRIMDILAALALALAITVVPVLAILFAPGGPSPPSRGMREALHQRPQEEATFNRRRRSTARL